jgi:hypothetical protein
MQECPKLMVKGVPSDYRILFTHVYCAEFYLSNLRESLPHFLLPLSCIKQEPVVDLQNLLKQIY